MAYLSNPATNTEYGLVVIGENIDVDDKGIISLPQSLEPTAEVEFDGVSVTSNLLLDGKQVITTVTPTAGDGISLSSVTTTGPHTIHHYFTQIGRALTRRKKTSNEPLPPYREVKILTGWCMGWEHEKNHAGCPGEIMHTYQNYKTVCPCECHGSENETNNENSKARRKVGA